jgi:hypothetical protein
MPTKCTGPMSRGSFMELVQPLLASSAPPPAAAEDPKITGIVSWQGKGSLQPMVNGKRPVVERNARLLADADR